MKHGKIIYTVPSIGSLTFGVEGNYRLEKFDGTSLGSDKLITTAINRSGQKTLRATLKSRTIPCELAVRGIDKNGRFSYELFDKLKQDICKIFNPLYTGTLTRVNRYGTYSIEVSPSDVPTFEKFVGATAKFKVNFVADKPMWRDTKVKTYHIGGDYGNTLKIYNTLGVDLPFILKGVVPSGGELFTLTKEETNESIASFFFINVSDWEFEHDTETGETKTKTADNTEYKSDEFIFDVNSAVDMVLSPGCNTFNLTADSPDSVFTIEVTDMFVGVS